MSSSRIRIHLAGDGQDGRPGQDGQDGLDGSPDGDLNGADGSDARLAESGEDGQDITLTLATLHDSSGEKLVQVHASATHGVLCDDVYPLNSAPVIRWTSKGGGGGAGGNGGRGGQGAPGKDGVDALPPDIPGSDGSPGGSGGKGGSASNGANGGKGGHVTVKVREKDLYLLMIVDPCKFRAKLLAGGKGGAAGKHGPGGSGGAGGLGGKPLSIPPPEGSGKKKNIFIKGGREGMRGADGLTPTWETLAGEDGEPGSFSIEVHEGGSFPERYHVAFENLELEGTLPMANPADCEFGDTISIKNIKIKNTGQMALPRNQEIHFCIKDAGDPNVHPLISRKDAFLPTGNTCGPGEFATSEGELKFFSGFPGKVEDEYDFNPLQQTANIYIQAFQYGPIEIHGKERISQFKKEFHNFHGGDNSTVNLNYSIGSAPSLTPRQDSVRVNLRYPLENRDGLRALRSLSPGEATIVSLGLENVSAVPLGGFDVDDPNARRNRRVAVRCFILRSRLFDMSSDMVSCTTIGTVEEKRVTIDLVKNPRLLDVPEIPPGESHNFQVRLALEKEVPLYSRVALIVDVFVQTLKLPRGMNVKEETYSSDPRMPSMSVIQRRKLEVICEPRYKVKESAKVVLVTSYATTRIQYETWTEYMLTETLKLDYEVFSVSRYGSLDPCFTVESGMTLKDAFRNKLVIVLTEMFKENPRDKDGIHPIELFPHGALQQTSGYESSTRWLIVGANEARNKQLLVQHLAAEPEESSEFPDVASYQKFISKLADERAAMGHEQEHLPIRMDTVNVSLLASKEGKAAVKLQKAAESLAEWLKSADPMNQYTIEYLDHELGIMKKKGIIKRKKACLEVRRGFCRSLNSVVCVAGKYTAEPRQIKSDGMIMSIAEAMSLDTKVSFLADAIRNDMPEKVITAFKYACVSDMIRESNNFLEAEMKMNDDLELGFPSISALLESVEMLSLLRECKTSEDIKRRTSDELSDLLARLELVANSKDLRPRFTLGMSQKKTTLEAMGEIVSRLRVQWKPVISNVRTDEVKKALKEEIKDFLKEDTGKKVLNVRADRRWIQGLNYVHSTENDNAFGICNASRRLMELDLDTQMENYKIPPPSVRVYSSKEIKALQQTIDARQARYRQITSSFQLKRQFDATDL